MGEGRRESEKEFWSRVEREGRLELAESTWAELLASGLLKRKAREELVERFQPLDGSRTRAWTTPDSWQCGRQQGRKPPLSLDEEKDKAIIWAYKHFKTDPSEAPTDEQKFWLMVAKKDPESFYKKYVVEAARAEACRREEERCRRAKQRRRREDPNAEILLAYHVGYDDCANGIENRYETDEAAQDLERELDEMFEEEEARLEEDAQEQEQERHELQRQAVRTSANGQPANLAVAAKDEDDWEDL
jgi:hypothetical protein